MLSLFDSYTDEAKMIIESMKKANIDTKLLIIEYKGVLPSGVCNPYVHFLGIDPTEDPKQALFFNELPIPNYWEIAGDGQNAKIYDGSQLKAIIEYHNSETRNRLIHTVHWLTKKEKKYQSDYYNMAGQLYKKTIYKNDSELIDIFIDNLGKQKIAENKKTKHIYLNDGGIELVFENKISFVQYYIEKLRLDVKKITFNTLSYSFFVARKFKHAEKILFWDEPIKASIPDNMNVFLDDSIGTKNRIYFISKNELHNFETIYGHPHSKVKYLGNLLNFSRRQSKINRKSILIATNSDQIAQLDYLVKELSNFEFHIAAPTLMSDKLMAFKAFDNVTLYPAVNQIFIDKKLQTVGIVLDINYGSEAFNISKISFLRGVPILGFNETIHREDFILKENQFLSTKAVDLVARVRSITKDAESYEASIRQQVNEGSNTSPEEYRHEILGEKNE